eukprot:1820647-Amphidinium_carterae.1
MAEVQAELEEMEASSSPSFFKINTPDFGADALAAGLTGQPYWILQRLLWTRRSFLSASWYWNSHA